MKKHLHSIEKLTRNENLVLATLQASRGPMSAYNILDELRDDGIRAPLQVYRALDKLQDYGNVHKLESLNAFIACEHPASCSQNIAAFSICDKCGAVNEIADKHFNKAVLDLARAQDFSARNAVIELTGICKACQLNASA